MVLMQTYACDVVTLTGGALAPPSFGGGSTYIHPVDAAAMVSREPSVLAD